MTQNNSQGFFYKLLFLDRAEFLKLIIGGILFFSIIGAYTLTQELKYGIFSAIVTPYHIPTAKLLAFVILFPAIILDGYLVDRFQRYQLVILYTFIFGVIGVFFTFFLSHPEIGINNTKQDVGRIFGWAFFLYVEAFAPFLLGVFWAFMNSIHNPKNAQKTYGFIVATSKVGGIVVTSFAYLFLSQQKLLSISLDGTKRIQIILLLASSLLLFASFFLSIMIKKLNLSAFKGYHTKINEKTKKTGVWIGIQLLLKNRYVLGIFLLVFLADILAEILNYKRILISVKSSQAANNELSYMLAKLYLQMFYMQFLGFAISLIFTNSLMRFLGTRFCMFIMPIFTLIFALTYILTGIDTIIIWLYIVIKAMYYTIGAPVRESLYIVTNKDIQFKAKFVIDALGIKLARNTGQAFNYMTNMLSKFQGQFASMLATNILFITIPIVWVVVAYFVGNTYNGAIKKDKVIA